MEQQIFINEIQTSFVLRQPKSTKPTNIYISMSDTREAS